MIARAAPAAAWRRGGTPRVVSCPPMGCLDDNQIVAYLHRTPAPAEVDRIDSHLDGCEACRTLVATLARASLLSADAPTLAPSDDVPVFGGGDYDLERLAAQGGMGQIWRASRRSDGRAVAIKRLSLAFDALPGDGRARLLREAAALERLRHPNVVELLGAGLDAGDQPFLVLEWLEGEDLSQRLARGPLPLGLAIEVVVQALRGLAAAHAAGAIHRDVKPGNLFLCGSESPPCVKLIDFGLALLSDESRRLTRAGELLGTLFYLSPEQAQGLATIDARSDIYSMGVVLYELCTGVIPFSAQLPAAVLLKIVTDTPPRPRQLRPELPLQLEQVILCAMQRRPEGRYASAEQMLAALTQVPGATGTHALLERAPLPLTGPGQASGTAAPASERRLAALLCITEHEEAAEGPTVAALIERAGGRVHRLLDGRLVGLFGIDQTVGDEPLRAVRVALAIGAAHAGRMRGLVATVHLEVGDGIRLDPEDLDRVLQALESLPAGEITVDEGTVALLGDRLQVERVGAFRAARGVATDSPVRVRVLGGPTPTVGREAELAAVRATFARALDDRAPAAVLLVGPPGIGKSRLLYELRPELQRASGLFLEARPDSAHSGTAYSLLADAIERAVGLDGRRADPARTARLRSWLTVHAPTLSDGDGRLIADALGLPQEDDAALRVARSDPKLMRQRLTEAFEALFVEAARAGPVTLCLEDLHWADEESVRLLSALSERLDDTPLLMLGSCRPELLERHPQLFGEVDGTRLHLGPLGRRALRRLIRRILGVQGTDALETRIARQSDGNPYFAEELSIWASSKPGHDEQNDALPTSIEAALQARLDLLPSEAKELAKILSVFFEDEIEERACAALGHADAAAALQTLQGAGFVTALEGADEPRRWRFRHDLVRQAAGRMLPEPRRQQLHRRLGGFYEAIGRRDAALLARHFDQAGLEHKAADYFAAAGRRALEDGDLAHAVEYYQRSLGVAPSPEAAAERAIGLARGHYLLGSFEQAASTVDSATPGSPRQRLELMLLRARIDCATASYERALDVLQQAQIAATDEDAVELGFEIRHTRFVALWGQGRYGEAARVADELQRIASERGRLDQLCSAKLAVAYCQVVGGDLARVLELSGEAVAHARAVKHPYRELDALLLLGSSRELVGAYEDARAALAEAERVAERLTSTYHLASIAVVEGRICNALGELGGALSRFALATERAQSIGDHRSLALALVGEARVRCRRALADDWARADVAARRALELAADRAPPVAAEAHLALAELCLARGTDAVPEALAAVELVDRLGAQEQVEVEVFTVAHDALRAAGRHQQAAQLFDRARRALTERAGRISAPELVESFLRRVPLHARLAATLEPRA